MRWSPGDVGVFVGRQRQGKTLNAVLLAWKLHLQGWPVVSNIELSFGRKIRTYEELLAVRHAVLLLDEIQVIADSRASLTEHQRLFTQKAIFFGKRGVIPLFTTPDVSFIDSRLRYLADRGFFCDKVYLRTGPASIVTFGRNPKGDGVFIKAGAKVVHHRKEYERFYDTLDEDVYLTK